MSMTHVELLQRWLMNCRRSQIANYHAANLFTRRNLRLGVPASVLSAGVGTSVFAALGSSVEPAIQIAVGALSFSAAGLSALQTFLRWGESTSKCREIGAEYGAAKRGIAQLLSSSGAGQTAAEDELTRIRERMDLLARDSPELPEKVWVAARRTLPVITASGSAYRAFQPTRHVASGSRRGKLGRDAGSSQRTAWPQPGIRL